MARILGITLARAGSKGVPGKTTRLLNGLPLIVYTIQQALISNLSRYIVSTNCPEQRVVALKAGAEAPFLRPDSLATDETTSVDALRHAVAWCESEEGQEYDYVVEIMCTNPMKKKEDINGCIDKLIKTGADSVIGVVKVGDKHPARMKRIVDDRLVDFCVPETSFRRQDLKPDAYVRNGSIYGMSRDKLMVEHLRCGSENSRPYVMPQERSVNIDTEIDWLVAEALLR
jgi:CMP-N-acetylneuraminic acid synthetase